jgi:hypothetical protein
MEYLLYLKNPLIREFRKLRELEKPKAQISLKMLYLKIRVIREIRG